MALLKRMELPSGVSVEYHRIVSVNSVTNDCTIVELASYTSQAKREEERSAIESRAPMGVFVDTRFIRFGYDKSIDVDSAYELVKQLDDFYGSEDVFEEGQGDAI